MWLVWALRRAYHKVRWLLGSVGGGCRIHHKALIRKGWRVHLGDRVRVGRRAVIDPVFGRGGPITIGDRTTIRENAVVMSYGGPITLGSDCSINPYSMLYGHGGLEIGDMVRIASHVVIIPANHCFDDPDVPIMAQGITTESVRIGDDVWIGANCTILDGVEIGSGSVVGAGSVVTRDVPPMSVAAGNPARVMRKRGEPRAQESAPYLPEFGPERDVKSADHLRPW